MLKQTFLHLPGIGTTLERRLWASGIADWDAYEASKTHQLPLFSSTPRADLSTIVESRRALAGGDVAYFVDRLPSSELYRVALTYPKETLFADIETTGLSPYYDYITMVGWEMNGQYDAYIRDSDRHRMRDAFAAAKVIVTFNGARFDLPFLRKEFPDLPIPRCHIDLRFFVRRAGVTGGQKEVEELMGLSRADALAGIAGEAAPVLWHRYRWGDMRSLKLLVTYNQADVHGLKGMMDFAVADCVRANGMPVALDALTKFSSINSKPRFVRNAKNKGIFLPPFAGSVIPEVVRSTLNVSDDIIVVGIDLTGSEERPSGWCAIRGEAAETRRVATDDELIDRTRTARASLVSIDSPLSLPVGRVSVGDDDPARSEFGITRQCERTLRQRGINVYPCLLPSMQRLTARGMLLAARFRELGIPVIESYPGAAQDIMGIPRKRASLELLARGLGAFGITGAFRNEQVSHDELDAITSAIVGLFFLSGRFEALGNDAEEYLIIPEIASGKSRWQGTLAIGLSGPIGAGKTTVGELLARKGFAYGRFSQVIDARARALGLEPSRATMQRIGLEIQKSGGQRRLGKDLVALLQGSHRVVIDGLRHREDHALLAEVFGPRFSHVAIDAPLAIRRSRAVQTGVSTRSFDISVSHEVESHVSQVSDLSHVRFDNAGSVDALQVGIDNFLRSLSDEFPDAR